MGSICFYKDLICPWKLNIISKKMDNYFMALTGNKI
jgi:hypothetical protein